MIGVGYWEYLSFQTTFPIDFLYWKYSYLLILGLLLKKNTYPDISISKKPTSLVNEPQCFKSDELFRFNLFILSFFPENNLFLTPLQDHSSCIPKALFLKSATNSDSLGRVPIFRTSGNLYLLQSSNDLF